jgi:NAD dependent epimerase/dehydratase family enzyme
MTQADRTDRVVIAGASGFIGTRLAASLRSKGAQVQTIGRHGADAVWGDDTAIRRMVDGAALLVNLAGKSVNCRYSERNRTEILRSRVETTRALGDAVLAASTPPPLWLNASTATIYRHAEDRPMTEAGGELGEGFSVGIAMAWEEEFFRFDLPATRRLALRTSIVLGRGSVLVPLRNLVRFGLGGPQLDGRWIRTPGRLRAGTFHEFSPTRGRQRFSWIHIDDVVGVIRFLRTSDLAGVVNVTSPNPSDNRTVMAALRRELGMPFGLPAFRWMLELGSIAIRTETELVLKSRWVLPERLLAAGYVFAHPDLDETVQDLLASPA